jgi:hypothetical protein
MASGGHIEDMSNVTSNVRASMADVVKAYKSARRALSSAERATAGAEDLRHVNVKRGVVAQAEEAMVLRMVGELGKAEPSKRDELYATFNRARTSVIYWPKMVSAALRYAGATV